MATLLDQELRDLLDEVLDEDTSAMRRLEASSDLIGGLETVRNHLVDLALNELVTFDAVAMAANLSKSSAHRRWRHLLPPRRTRRRS